MAVDLVTVTGNLETLIGTDPQLGRVWFRLSRPDWNLDGDVFAPRTIEAIAATGGAFSVDLQSTDSFENGAVYSALLLYHDTATNTDQEFTLSSFMVPTGGPWQLGDLLVAGSIAPVPVDILAAAQAYALAAAASANQAALWAATAQARWVETHPIAGLANPITLGVIPVNKSLVDIRIDGVSQQQSDFSLSGDELTFIGGWPVGADNAEIVYYGSVLSRDEVIAGGTTFAMELADAATAGNVSATAATATYARIGNMVFVSVRFIDINTAGLTAGNDVYLRGLPFTGSTANFGGGTIYANNLAFTGQLTPILNAAAPSTLSIAKMTTGATVTFVKASDITTGVTDLFLNFWYFI